MHTSLRFGRGTQIRKTHPPCQEWLADARELGDGKVAGPPRSWAASGYRIAVLAKAYHSHTAISAEIGRGKRRAGADTQFAASPRAVWGAQSVPGSYAAHRGEARRHTLSPERSTRRRFRLAPASADCDHRWRCHTRFV